MAAFANSQHLIAFLRDAGRLCAWLVLLAVIFLPLERLFALHPKKFFRKALWQDLGYFFISGLIPGLLLAAPFSIIAIGGHALVPHGVQETISALPLWQRVLAGLVVGEIGFYWGHRWTHEIPFLWRFHSIHHSAEQVYFLTSARAHPIDSVFTRLCGLIPIYVLGIATPLTPAGGVVSALLVMVITLWGFFIHANVRWRLGALEWLVATPAFHHWHHTLGAQRDCNYAPMLPWIDMIFGTYHLPRHEWPAAYGIDVKLPGSLAGQLLYPLRPVANEAPASKAVVADR